MFCNVMKILRGLAGQKYCNLEWLTQSNDQFYNEVLRLRENIYEYGMIECIIIIFASPRICILVLCGFV